MPTSSTSASAPYAPIWWSRMIARARSRVVAPSASAVSASASKWSAPVRAAPRATASAAASNPPSDATAPTAAPMPAPTTGKNAPPRATSRPSRTIQRPTGTRVRKATAPAKALTACIGDVGVLEGRHVVEDRDRRRQQRQRERRARAFAEAQAEIEEGLEAERIEDERVARLGAAMRGDQVVSRTGSKHRCGGDEAVDEDDGVVLCGSPDQACKKCELESAERREGAQALVPRERTAHDVDLGGKAGVVEPRPAPADERRIGAQKSRRQ